MVQDEDVQCGHIDIQTDRHIQDEWVDIDRQTERQEDREIARRGEVGMEELGVY